MVWNLAKIVAEGVRLFFSPMQRNICMMREKTNYNLHSFWAMVEREGLVFEMPEEELQSTARFRPFCVACA